MSCNGLDTIDLKILTALQEDASRSGAEIAEVVGLAPLACWRRIQRLKEEGYISRVVALLDRNMLAMRLQLFVQVKMERTDQVTLAEFTQAIRQFPEVLECHAILGMFDFLLRVVTRDIDEYQQFYLERLSRVPHIREVNSFVAGSVVKSSTALPLPW